MSSRKMIVDHSKTVGLLFPKEDEHLFRFMKRFERTALRKGWNQEEVNAVFDNAFWYCYDEILETLLDHCLFPESDSTTIEY